MNVYTVVWAYIAFVMCGANFNEALDAFSFTLSPPLSFILEMFLVSICGTCSILSLVCTNHTLRLWTVSHFSQSAQLELLFIILPVFWFNSCRFRLQCSCVQTECNANLRGGAIEYIVNEKTWLDANSLRCIPGSCWCFNLNKKFALIPGIYVINITDIQRQEEKSRDWREIAERVRLSQKQKQRHILSSGQIC